MSLGQQHDKVLELLDTHGRRLHQLLGRLTRSEDATSDLMQELFLRLSLAKGLERARDPYAYAWRAAANLAFEWRRRQRIKPQLLEEDMCEDEPQGRPPGKVIRDEQVQRVLEATSQLDELARNVIVMRFVEQEPYEEIAVRLGRDAAYLRSLCSKTLVRLRQMCGDHEAGRTDKGGAS
jgi:RNA polymerase sigma factor (sigma-70 family)